MKPLKRRSFLQLAISGAACSLAPGEVIGANERIRIGVIGLGIRGPAIAQQAVELGGAEIAALCDVDRNHLDAAADKLIKRKLASPKVRKETDFRKLLEDPEIDAVLIATPNHWHALMTVMACEAGKDVMVEKPVCHTLEEGWRMIDAAKKTGRIVSGGYQQRADSGLLDLQDFLKSESDPYGPVKGIHALWLKIREPIGKRRAPLKPPTSVDYELWLGPAQDDPILRENFHYDWHWIWNTGDGEMANLGSHNLDIARWFAGDAKDKPVKLTAAGNRFVWDDAGQTPNMQWAGFDFGNGIPVTLQVRDLAMKPGSKAAAAFKGIRAGMVVQFEEAEFRGGRGGGMIYGPDNKVIRKFPGDGGKDHLPSFFRAIRSRKSSDLRCTLEDSVYSSQSTHLANIATRAGSAADPAQVGQALADGPELTKELWQDLNRHMQAWEIDYSKQPWLLGSGLEYDWKGRKFLGSSDLARKAQTFHQRENRKGWEFPA